MVVEREAVVMGEAVKGVVGWEEVVKVVVEMVVVEMVVVD